MYTLKHPTTGTTFLRRYKTFSDAAKDALSILEKTGIFYLIVGVK